MIQTVAQREDKMLISRNYATTKQLKLCTSKPTNPPGHLKQNYLHPYVSRTQPKM